MIRPTPRVVGSHNPAVKPDGGMPKTDDASPMGVPKMLRDPKILKRARERAAKDDRMRYIRTDVGGGGYKAGDSSAVDR